MNNGTTKEEWKNKHRVISPLLALIIYSINAAFSFPLVRKKVTRITKISFPEQAAIVKRHVTDPVTRELSIQNATL